MTEALTREKLYHLLQDVYYRGVDAADADAAVQAFTANVRWVHHQVWEHDGHGRGSFREINGRDAVRDFLADRIPQMGVIGISHHVDRVLADGEAGAFRAHVLGPDGVRKPFFGWVEMDGDRIATYIIGPET